MTWKEIGEASIPCATCGGAGFTVTYENSIPSAYKCDDCADARTAHHAGIAITQSGIAPSERAMRLGAFRRDAHPEAARMLAAAWRLAKRETTWLLLLGQHGCGKSHIAIGCCINEAELRRSTIQYLVVPEWVAELRAAIDRSRPDDLVREAQAVGLLAMDEMRLEDLRTDFRRENIEAVLHNRHRKEMPTIICSNMLWSEFKAALPRIASRAQQLGEVVEITKGKDMRGVK